MKIRRFPVVGHLPQIAKDPLNFLLTYKDYGDIVPIYPGPDMGRTRKAYLLNKPEFVDDVLVRSAKDFKKFGYDIAIPLLGTLGLITTEGDDWKQARKLTQPAFSKEKIRNYAQRMRVVTKQFIEGWQVGQTLDLQVAFSELTLSNILSCLVSRTGSVSTADIRRELGRCLHEVQARFTSFNLPLWIPTEANKRFASSSTELNQIIYSIVDLYIGLANDTKDDVANDLFSSLVEAWRDEKFEGIDKDRRFLRDNLVTNIFAGSDTTAGLIMWFFYLISQNPAAEEQVYQEILALTAENDFDALQALVTNALPYTLNALDETLRLYPAAWILFKQTLVEHRFGDTLVPAGTTLWLSSYAMQRDAKYYEAPNEFRPQRWTDEFRANLPKVAYFPFSRGQRKCIGEDLARVEAIVVITTIIKAGFRFKLEPNQNIIPIATGTLKAKNGVVMRLSKSESRAV